jgi:hypothetical protein
MAYTLKNGKMTKTPNAKKTTTVQEVKSAIPEMEPYKMVDGKFVRSGAEAVTPEEKLEGTEQEGDELTPEQTTKQLGRPKSNE